MKNGFVTTPYDPAFYKFDSLDASILYIINNEKVVYKAPLKSASLPTVYELLKNNNLNVGIDYPLRGSIKLINGKFLILDPLKHTLYTVAMNKPDSYVDSVDLLTAEVEKRVFQAHFGDKGLDMYYANEQFLAKNPELKNKSTLAAFTMENDTLCVVLISR